QIHPPPDDAPRAPVEMAEHPFILEFPLMTCGTWRITNHRRIREHIKLTRLLNVLLAGDISFQPLRTNHFWGMAHGHDQTPKWVKQFFIANLGEPVLDELSRPAAEQLQELEPKVYYTAVGHDGQGLRVPADLDDSICCYMSLPPTKREKFDRATFW